MLFFVFIPRFSHCICKFWVNSIFHGVTFCKEVHSTSLLHSITDRENFTNCITASLHIHPGLALIQYVPHYADRTLSHWAMEAAVVRVGYRCVSTAAHHASTVVQPCFSHKAPQWGAADAEIKVPSGESTELKRSPFKAWSRSVYSHTCYAYCQGFLPCLFLPFWSSHLHFFQTSPKFFLC